MNNIIIIIMILNFQPSIDVTLLSEDIRQGRKHRGQQETTQAAQHPLSTISEAALISGRLLQAQQGQKMRPSAGAQRSMEAR